MLECLDNLVGITQGDCECVDYVAPETIFPFYLLDDYDYSIPLTSIAAGQMCGDGGVISIAQQALQTGKNSLVSDFQTLIGEHYKPSSKKFSGPVGQISKASNWKSFKDGKNGIKVYGRKGIWYIDNIAVKLSDGQTVTVEIRNDRDELVHSEEILAIAGTLTKKAVDIQLPMEDEFGVVEYEITYEFTGTAYDIKFACGCSDDNYRSIRQWFMLESINGGDKSADSYTAGLMITGKINCSVENVICSVASDEASKMALSRLLQLYAIRALANKVVMSNKINAFTTLNKQGIELHVRKLEEQINYRLQWIFERTDMTSQCWECVSDFEIEVVPLII